jgi:trans-aconitate 2-methyltransferase
MTWSSAQYTRFEAERSRPVLDLVAHIPTTPVAKAVDIGCGPGNSTEILKARYPDADVTGMDSSPDMIAAARQRLPDIAFAIDDITGWRGSGPYDVILSNAALQWVPDHETLLPALIDKLAPGGSLAVQAPDNHDEPAHRLMREVAAEGPWAPTLAPVLAHRAERPSVDAYYRLLREHAPTVDIWRTTYHHRLAEGPKAVTDWFRSTGLRRYLLPLDAEQQAGFLARYQAAIDQAYPPMPDGAALLPFPRLFFIATR